MERRKQLQGNWVMSAAAVRLAVGDWRHASPTLKRANEGRWFRKPNQERHVFDTMVRSLHIAERGVPTDFVEQGGEACAFLAQPSRKRTPRYLHFCGGLSRSHWATI